MSGTFSIAVTDLEKSCLTTPRWWGAQVDLGGGEVFVADGQVFAQGEPKDERTIDSVEIVNALTCSSKPIKDDSSMNVRGTDPVLLSRGRVMILGGSKWPDIYLYNPKTSDVTIVGTLYESRSGSAQQTIANDVPLGTTGDINSHVLVTGGYAMAEGVPKDKSVLASVECVHLMMTTEGIQVATPHRVQAMHYARAGHTLTKLSSGEFFVTGGKGNSDLDSFATAEVYSPTTETFTLFPDKLNFPRKDHRAVVDGQDRIWLIGGTGPDGNSVAELEYFDPVAKKFVVAKKDGVTVKLSVGREDAAAVFVEELNAIVVSGGEAKHMAGDKSVQISSAAIDVISLDDFSVVSTMAGHKRDESTMTLLPGDPDDHQTEIILLQGADETHHETPSEKIVVKRN